MESYISLTVVEKRFWTPRAFVMCCIVIKISLKSQTVSVCFLVQFFSSCSRQHLAACCTCTCTGPSRCFSRMTSFTTHREYKNWVFLCCLANDKWLNNFILFVWIWCSQNPLNELNNTTKISSKYLVTLIGIKSNFKGVWKPFFPLLYVTHDEETNLV